MNIPIKKSEKNPKAVWNAFYGLNRRRHASEGEMSAMKNLSSDAYPYISPRKPREDCKIEMKNISAMICPHDEEEYNKFTGIADGNFYYKDEKLGFEDDTMSIDKNAFPVVFNALIIIAPMMYYIDCRDDVKVIKKMKKGLYECAVTIRSTGEEDDIESKITASGVDFGEYFKEGESIFLDGFTGNLEINNTCSIDSRFENASDDRNVSVVIEKIDGSTMNVSLYNRHGKRIPFKNGSSMAYNSKGTINICVPIPEMNHVCVHLNRLWGTNPNGEFIYASKQGNPFSFYCFEGLSTDSWYSEIGTEGGFVGLVSYRDNVVAFKKGYIHQVYGDKPSNYSIPKQLSDCGCIDIKSVCQIGLYLYFLGYNGFYVYSGGQPLLISEKLNCDYKSALAFTDGKKYYACAQNYDGIYELLVYDTVKGMWHMEDNIKITASSRGGNNVYIAADDRIYRLCGKEGQVNWCAEIWDTDENMFFEKGINDLHIRAYMEEGSSIKVFTKSDDGEYILWDEIGRPGTNVYRIPVRLKKSDRYGIKLEGEGYAEVEKIERAVYAGGSVTR